MMVKADSVDVNAAQINRMTPRAWEIAAQLIREELAGIRLLTEEQVRDGLRWNLARYVLLLAL
jgi:hypothetical protein